MVAELRNYIANLNTSGSIALNITKASAYLKNQRRELEASWFPQAALNYTTLLSEIRKLEQEISSRVCQPADELPQQEVPNPAAAGEKQWEKERSA